MSRQTTTALVGAAAIGVGLLSMSSALAAPANGAVIGDAASAAGVSERVLWRGGVGWRGVGWRGVGWRGVGWRPGWRYGWGWRPGLAAAGAAATGIAATAAYNSYGYGYGNYGYGPNYGPGPFTGTPNYIYTTATAPRYIYGYTVVPGYGYTAAGYGNDYGYGNNYGGYWQPGVGAAAVGAAAAGATAAGATAVGQNVRVAQARYAYRHNYARER
jgi:hypothetical protein